MTTAQDGGKVVSLMHHYRPGVAQRFPDFVTTAQDGGKVVNLMHRYMPGVAQRVRQS